MGRTAPGGGKAYIGGALYCCTQAAGTNHVPGIFDCNEGKVLGPCRLVPGHNTPHHPRHIIRFNGQAKLGGHRCRPVLIAVVWHTRVLPKHEYECSGWAYTFCSGYFIIAI